MKSSGVTTQSNVTEQYFLVPFIVLYKVVLTFESLDEIQKYYITCNQALFFSRKQCFPVVPFVSQ